MIYDQISETVVGNSWADKGSIWTFDLKTQTESHIPVAGAEFLTLRPGSNGIFGLVHHHSVDHAISIRRLSEPDRELASIRFSKGRPAFNGDLLLWKHVDPAAIIHTSEGPKLVLIDAAEQRIKNLDLTWYTNGNYDLGYQGLIDCMTLAIIDRMVVSVQRSSKLVIIDLERNKPVDSIELCDRGGNPALRMRTATEFLASDYDTLCRVDVRSLSVLQSALLQGAAGIMRQFIGDFDVREGVVAVARPFSGDALLLDSGNFKTLGRVRIGGQPLAISMISESKVVARDWKTGHVAIGQF